MRSYDLILFTAERTLDEWIDVLSWAIKSSSMIMTFVHQNSPSFSMLTKIVGDGIKVSRQKTLRGEWITIRIERKRSYRNWVVTHKPDQFPKLPAGYEWIHAGKKFSKFDLGILGDDTGDNVSELNSKINELTIHYWVWKNFQTDYVGFSHYRRYFVMPGDGEVMIGKNHEHILTMDEAIEMLKDCDVIVDRTEVLYASPKTSNQLDYQLVRKYIAQIHPEDLELFDSEFSRTAFNCRSMFITHWKVFDAYCKWLFSFLIPAAREFQPRFIGESRAIAYYGEFMLTAFLRKYNLRVKNLRILSGNSSDFSKPEVFSYLDRTVF